MQGLQRSRRLDPEEVSLRVGNGVPVKATHVGTYELSLSTGMVLSLHNCLCVPAMSRNIISVSCLALEGFSFKIENNSCFINKGDMFYSECFLNNGLYVLNTENPIYNINTKRLRTRDPNPTYLWHCRLGHINEQRVKKLHRNGLLDSFDFEPFDTCVSCLLGKMTKDPFLGIGERANDLLGLVHTDVCGPINIMARGGYFYFITFTDDISRYGYIYLMRRKSESFDKFKEYKSEVENQLGKKIKILRSDRGGEYLSQEFKDYLKESGIVSELTPPITPQWNGVSERRNRTLLDMVRSMMSHSGLPLSFWGYALEAALLILNRSPSKSVEKIPYEVWHGKVPKVSFLRVWGCKAYVKKLLHTTKLEPRSTECIFVGYPKETKGYYFYIPNENKIIVARNAVFLENEFLQKEDNGSRLDLEEIREKEGENDLPREDTSTSDQPPVQGAEQELVASPGLSGRGREDDVIVTPPSPTTTPPPASITAAPPSSRQVGADRWMFIVKIGLLQILFPNQWLNLFLYVGPLGSSRHLRGIS